MTEYPKNIVEFAEREGHMHRNTHVVLTGESHSDVYGNYRFLGPQEDGSDLYLEAREHYVRMLLTRVCKSLKCSPEDIFWVGPETMGAVMVDCLACVVYEDTQVVVEYLALSKDGAKAFQVPNDLDALNPSSKPVVFLDDVLTGGTTLKKAKPITDKLGGVHAAAIWMDRSNLHAYTLGVHQIIPLESVKASVWTEDDCAKNGPCKDRVPVRTDIGKPDPFLKRNQVYPTTE